MNLFLYWWKDFLARGFKFRITLPWKGEKNLGNPKEPENMTQHEFNQEFLKEQDRKKGGKGGTI